MKYRMADEIANVLMGQQPEHAHAYALEQIINGHNPDLWRNVLTELDKLEAKNESMERRSDNYISGRTHSTG
jgi:hypothetical protein